MWEEIARNKRRSRWLVAFLGAALVGLGAAIGGAVDPRGGPALGALVALTVWGFLLLIAFAEGDRILLASAGGRPIEKSDAPQLWNIVEEMTIAAGLPKMPAVYVLDDSMPNAFAVGRRPDRAALAVTTGLLRRLSRDELQGVVAHEIGHIRNLDVRFMTLATVMVGSIVLIADLYLRMVFYGGGRRSSRRDDGGGGGQQYLILLAIVLAVLAPLAARLLYFAVSRRREYLADASSARFTRYPEGLASALEKIAGAASTVDRGDQTRALAPLYTVNPLQASGESVGLFSTHPPTAKRIQILRGMAGGAGFGAYEQAFRQVEPHGRGLIGARTLSQADRADLRPPTSEDAAGAGALDRTREALGHLDRQAGLLTIPCACGLRIKVPAKYEDPRITCPRCGTVHDVARPSATPPLNARLWIQGPEGRKRPKGLGSSPANSPIDSPSRKRNDRAALAWRRDWAGVGMDQLELIIEKVRAGLYGEALREYAAIERDPRYRLDVLGHRAWLYRSMGRLDESLADYDTLVAEAPEHLVARANRADTLLVAGRADEAAAAAGGVLAIDPMNETAAAVVLRARLALGRDNGFLAGLAFQGEDPLGVRFGLAAPEEGGPAGCRLARFPLGEVVRNKRRFPSRYDYYSDVIRRLAPGGRFLDLGAMWLVDGRFSFEAEAAGAREVVACDVIPASAAFRRKVARQASRVRFVEGDLMDPALPAMLGQFDTVFCSGVLYHLPIRWRGCVSCAGLREGGP